MFLQYIAH